ncbi:hypothetical protein MSAN_00573100 [Mycena sanguinolenta]|uniref:Uncharacterized protein n=1 Tax=Mycena sanguinolenta TaxID=230812 RepID=A0A8H6ZA45_9AGAR|nr:hypothetical protein MSAN_00573100 [Mycena sanguinolenta]
MVLFIAAAVLPLLAFIVAASPYSDAALRRRNDTTPDFPSSPASCGLCAQASAPFSPYLSPNSTLAHVYVPLPLNPGLNYSSIELCITVIPVVANFTTVIENPGSFADVLTCGCSPTFNITFPECVDCFENTNQQQFLNISDPDAVLTGLTKVCELEQSVGIGGNGALVNSIPLFSLGLGAVVLMLGNAW